MDAIRKYYERLLATAQAAATKDVADLTNDDKVALAAVAGAEIETVQDPNDPFRCTLKTVNPVGFARLTPDGPITVYVRLPERQHHRSPA
jgi:hypothetical protein